LSTRFFTASCTPIVHSEKSVVHKQLSLLPSEGGTTPFSTSGW
jgi:hypothetical protein